MLIKFCSLVSPKVRHTFFVKLRQVRPHDRVSDGKIWSFVMLILQMITNFRFKRFYVVAPCGIETSWGALFLSPQWHLHYSKASSFPCIHSTTNPSLSRSYVLNISKKKWDSEQTFPHVTCSNTQCVRSRWMRQRYAVIFQTNVKAQPNNGQGVPIFSWCMRSTV